ncbi:MAG: ABC transporter ATP-binding protein [Planctomycetota bacterium]|nr:ABC transporter ATP-binding protein [Planctomycetota bacterium]
MNRGDPFVRVEDVTKTFAGKGEDVTPLRELDLVVEKGEFTALMGPSGSGKSTLLHLIAGIDQPTEGHVKVGDVLVSGLRRRQLARWRNREVGFVFQQYNLVPVLTAFENVELPLLLTSLSKSERDRKVQVALEAVDLTDRSDHLPREMSGGQQQRVAIARAIVAGPSLLLADEPTGNLDEHAAENVLELLRALHERFGLTLVMVTHDPRAAAYAERVVHLDKGHITSDARNVVEEAAS